jgi:hypothetical protein
MDATSPASLITSCSSFSMRSNPGVRHLSDGLHGTCSLACHSSTHVLPLIEPCLTGLVASASHRWWRSPTRRVRAWLVSSRPPNPIMLGSQSLALSLRTVILPQTVSRSTCSADRRGACAFPKAIFCSRGVHGFLVSLPFVAPGDPQPHLGLTSENASPPPLDHPAPCSRAQVLWSPTRCAFLSISDAPVS